jgi:phosphoribosylformylglycinamidine cyclo-ligase
VRKLFVDSGKYDLEQHIECLGRTLADELLESHRCYAKPVLKLLEQVPVHGMAHITGGGLTDNVPRILPGTLDAEIDTGSWEPLMIFDLIKRDGDIAPDEMSRTFNMGVGMVLIVSPDDEAGALEILGEEGEKAWILGRIVKGNGVVRYKGK